MLHQMVFADFWEHLLGKNLEYRQPILKRYSDTGNAVTVPVLVTMHLGSKHTLLYGTGKQNIIQYRNLTKPVHFRVICSRIEKK